HPGGEWDSRLFTARDAVELLEPRLAEQGLNAEIDQRGACAREGDQASAVGIDRTGPTGGEDEGLVRHEADRLHLDERLRREFGHYRLVGKRGRARHAVSRLCSI